MRTRDRLWSAHGREPTVDELATALDRSREDIVDALAAGGGQHSQPLDAPVGDEEHGTTRLDMLGATDAALANVERRLLADELVKGLDKRARTVLRMRFELDLLQWEIAERVGVSQMHVSRILRDALNAAAGSLPAAA